MLINGLKFDLRLYVVLTCINPLRIYLFNEGLVRFATEPYTKHSLSDLFIHLTNFSINKKNKKVKEEGKAKEGDPNRTSTK